MFNRLCVALLSVSLLLLAGCGGSGGSGPSFHYASNWSQSGMFGPTGNSQLVRLLKADGTDVVNPVVLPKVAGTNHTSLSGFPAGTYRFRAELRANNDGTGGINGVCEEFVTITGSTTLSTDVGGN